jgi:Tol biopolymer transport system component/DNA-binding winged helix-turn-helix (wHTH) protein
MTPFRIGEFLVRPDLNRIKHGDLVHQVEPRLIQILVSLASQQGRVVSRATLMDEIWGDVIVSDETITVAVSELRRLLKDDPRKPRYIETIRKGGYRLIMAVEDVSVGDGETPVAAEPLSASGNGETINTRPIGPAMSWRRATAWGALALTLAIFGFVVQSLQTQPSPPPAFLVGTPFTSYPGAELHPAISGDGNRVAFSWKEPGNDNYDIYVKQRNTEHALRVTDHIACETHPVWSPDGSQVAYIREPGEGNETGIYVVPSIGGVPRRLIRQSGSIFGLSWSPDGEWLVYSAADSIGGLAGLHKLSLKTFESVVLTSPQDFYACDFAPAVSPDGEQIAFIRSQGPSFKQDIHLLPFAGGNARQMTESQRQVRGLAWLGDSKSIVFSASPNATLSLWRLDLEKEKVTWLPTKGIKAGRPCIPTGSDLMIYEDLSFNYDVYRIDLDKYDGTTETVAPLITSTRSDYGASFSPDGTRFVFVSTRSGNRELWLADETGGQLTQLTHYGGAYLTRALWSPDGQDIVYNVYVDGLVEIHTLNLESITSRCLLSDEGHVMLYGWLHRQNQIYYTLNDDGVSYLLWKMNPDGSDQRLHGRVIFAVAGSSPDGEYTYCYKRSDWGIWRYRAGDDDVEIDLDRQEMELVVSGETMISWSDWVSGEDGIYFTRSGPGGSVLGRVDYESKQIEILGYVPGNGIVSLSMSPDKRTLLYSATEQVESDLILVDGFK